MSKPTTVEVITVSKGVEGSMSLDLTKEAVIRVPTRTISVASHPLTNLLEGILEPIPARYFYDSIDEEKWLVFAPVDLNQPSVKIYYNPAMDRQSLFPYTFFKGNRKDDLLSQTDKVSQVVKYLVLVKFDKRKIAKLAGQNLRWVEVMCNLGVSVVKQPTPKPQRKDGRWVQTKPTIVLEEGPSFGGEDFDRVGPTFESRPTG